MIQLRFPLWVRENAKHIIKVKAVHKKNDQRFCILPQTFTLCASNNRAGEKYHMWDFYKAKLKSWWERKVNSSLIKH